MTTLEIPYKIGDKICVDGNSYVILGMHIYITQNSNVVKWRFHIGHGRFVTVENTSQETKNT